MAGAVHANAIRQGGGKGVQPLRPQKRHEMLVFKKLLAEKRF